MVREAQRIGDGMREPIDELVANHPCKCYWSDRFKRWITCKYHKQLAKQLAKLRDEGWC